MKFAHQILKRHPANPLISTKDYPDLFQIFNPSPAVYNGKTILLVSAVAFNAKRNGITRVAESDDGIHFTMREGSFVDPSPLGYPFAEMQHLIDNRVTKIDDIYYILTPAGSAGLGMHGPLTLLGKTRDFKTYEPVDIISLPGQRGASLFPEKINGKFRKLDRPGYGTGSRGSIYISESPDLLHWGSYRPLVSPGQLGKWTMTKLGPTPPIKTEQGWLVIVHGVYTPCDGPHYSIGAMLLDLQDPQRIIGHTTSYLLWPEEDYETRGAVDNVVFPCGALADLEKDELRLYYGAADTRVCLATGSVQEVVEACLNHV